MAIITLDRTGYFKEFRTKTGFTDDPDWVTTNDYDSVVSAGAVAVPTNPEKPSIAVYGKFFDASGDVVTTGRGEFTLTPIRLVSTGKSVVDGSPTADLVGGRRYLLSDTQRADFVSVRITAITAPSTATHIKLFMEALSR